MQEIGPRALGIVALINLIMGLILAFVGATQLNRFGASIYTADLVAIATVREMGCIMTAIIMCGRTGAAFAAQLGTMKVNQEIEAFRTFGFNPVEFLVLPRILALIIMMPLLVVFADLISIAGGFVVPF
jgi:phospholipid/cholesterol/gamma-HCH transport system permease protein